MTHVTCRLTAKNRDQHRNPMLGNRVWATLPFYIERDSQETAEMVIGLKRQRPTSCCYAHEQVCVQLSTSADSVTNPRICCYAPCCGAAAADRRPASRAATGREWPSPQRQTRGSGVPRPDGTDRRTDARQFLRPFSAYYAGGANNCLSPIERRSFPLTLNNL